MKESESGDHPSQGWSVGRKAPIAASDRIAVTPPPKVKAEPHLTDQAHPSDEVGSIPLRNSANSHHPWQLPDGHVEGGTKRSFYAAEYDEEPSVEPYNPGKEPLPKKEINHGSFCDAERAARRISEEIISIIDEQDCRNEDIVHIYDQTKNALKVKYPSGVKIGLRGDSGVGKSSVINSLLGIQNIAPQSDGGGACTSVVHEFQRSRSDQQDACESEITFLSPVAREAVLKEWLKDFFIFEHSGAEPGDEVFEKYEEASSTAVAGLFSLFCDRDECQTKEAIHKFLSSAASQDDPGVISKMKGWVDDLLNNLGVVSGRITKGAAMPENIQDEIGPYIEHVSSYDADGRLSPSPWPLVKLVRTYFDSPLLMQDIILADLPGTSDTNQTRVRASQVYLKEADYTGVVTRVDRAETDLPTHRYLIDAFRRRRGASVLLVATSSDSVNTKAAYLNRTIAAADAVDAENLTTLREELDMLSLELGRTQQEQQKARRVRDRDAIANLKDKWDMLKSQQTSLQARLSEYCVKLRNFKVARNVRKKYFELTKDPVPLPTFCISNSDYTVHTIGYSRNEPPKMSVEATEIPKLRAFLHSLPATRKFRAFEHHRNVVLPSLLNCVEMTCSQTKLMRREVLQNILLSASAPVSNEIEKSFRDFLVTKIVPSIATIEAKKTVYADHAVAQISRLKAWNSLTHKAFCFHKGNWSTKKVGKHDWNREMLEPLINDIERDTRHWKDSSNHLSTTLSEKLYSKMNDLVSQLEGAAGPSKNSMRSYFDQLRIERDLFGQMCQARVELLERDLAATREKIIDTSDTQESYFIRIMAQTYDECCNITGTGARDERNRLLKSKIAQTVRGPFLKLFNMAKGTVDKIVQKHIREFTTEVEKSFARFNSLFKMTFKTEDADTPEGNRLRELLRARVTHFRSILTEEVDRHLAVCRKFTESHPEPAEKVL